MCACACARAGGGMPICTMCVCIDACASRHVRMPRCAHTHIGGSACVRLQPISSCMRVRIYIYIYICVYRWLGVDRCASVYICIYISIYSDICIPIIYLLCTHMCACTHVRAHVRARCARRHRYVCVPRQMPRAYRWIRSPSIHLNISMCVWTSIYISTHALWSGIETRCARAIAAGARGGCARVC